MNILASSEQQLRVIREKALDVAGYQHKEDDEVKAVDTRITQIRNAILSEQRIMASMQKELNVEVQNRRKILMPFIPEELRG